MTAALTTAQVQVWIAIVVGLGTVIAAILKYFDVRSATERSSAAGQAFQETVDALASTDQARQRAGAILLRRFFDRGTEQGTKHAPYATEALGVMAALLRDTSSGTQQKLLADGLGYAPSLRHADLQQCNLQDAHLGERPDRSSVDLSHADLYKADLTGASLRGAKAHHTVFYAAVLQKTVLNDCDLTGADFRDADLTAPTSEESEKQKNPGFPGLSS